MNLYILFTFFVVTHQYTAKLSMKGGNTKDYKKMPFSNYVFTPNQQKMMKSFQDSDKSMIICTGPSGTGKTVLSCLHGIECIQNNKKDKLIITRPVVSVEEELGYLPGTIKDKMSPWTRPIMDILHEYWTPYEVLELIRKHKIEIAPLAYMRGRTFQDALIIADEMQNSSPNQFKMLTTRVGKGSKLVVNGDLSQCDLPDGSLSGLYDFLEKQKLYQSQRTRMSNLIVHHEFSGVDIKRSPLTREIIDIYDIKSEQQQKQQKQQQKQKTQTIKVTETVDKIKSDYENNDASMYPPKEEIIMKKYLK